MNESTGQKLGGGAGVLFAVLVVLPFLTLADAPDHVDDPETISQFFVDNEGKIFGAALFAMLSAFALAWFVSALREVLGRETDGRGRPELGAIVIGGAIAASSYAIGGAILAVGARRVSEQGAAGAASSFVNWDLFQVIFGGAGPIGLAVLLSGVAVFALRGGRFIPTWLGWVSLVLAIVGLIPPISFVLTIGIAIWALIVAILMLRAHSTT